MIKKILFVVMMSMGSLCFSGVPPLPVGLNGEDLTLVTLYRFSCGYFSTNKDSLRHKSCPCKVEQLPQIVHTVLFNKTTGQFVGSPCSDRACFPRRKYESEQQACTALTQHYKFHHQKKIT